MVLWTPPSDGKGKEKREKVKEKVPKEPFQHLGASLSIRKLRLERAYAQTSIVQMGALQVWIPLDSKPAPRGSTFVGRQPASGGPRMGSATTISRTSEKLGLLRGLEIHRRAPQQQPSMPVVIRCLIYRWMRLQTADAQQKNQQGDRSPLLIIPPWQASPSMSLRLPATVQSTTFLRTGPQLKLLTSFCKGRSQLAAAFPFPALRSILKVGPQLGAILAFPKGRKGPQPGLVLAFP